MAIAKVSPGRGAEWIRTAVGMVIDEPGTWIGGFVATLVVTIVLSFIPWVGGFLGQLLGSVMSIFFLCFADAQRKGVAFDFDQCLENIRPVIPRLIVMFFVSFALYALSALPLLGGLMIAGGSDFMTAQAKGESMQIVPIVLVFIGAMISMVLGAFVMSATWLVTPQILFQRQTIMDSMRNSFQAIFKNVLPLFFYGIFMSLFFLACCVPLFLGLFIFFPASAITFYLTYEEILGKAEPMIE